MTASQYYEARNSGPGIRQAGHRKIQRGFNKETMATLMMPKKTTEEEHSHPANGKVGLLTREEVAEVEAEVAAILAPAAAPARLKSKSLLASLMHPMLALWDEISGPPMTQRERNARDLAEASHHRYPGMGGF